MSETFVDWGIPTATALGMARRGAPGLPLIASGGLRTGLDAAKAIALGADMAGFAGPLLRAAAVSEDDAVETLTALVEEVRLAMFCTGSGTIAELKHAELLFGGLERWEFAGECVVGGYRFSGERKERNHVD
jgi:isopentenyl-diphosphate delta-isomerase